MPDQHQYGLLSRGAGEAYSAAGWRGKEQPADLEELLIAGAVIGERWKTVDLYLNGQTTQPKELDALSDGTNLWTVKRITASMDRNIYRCYAMLADAVPALAIAPSSLPGGTHAVAYSQQITASGGLDAVIGNQAYTYTVTTGTLPAGLTLTASGAQAGRLSGTPTTVGSSTFTVTATDIAGFTKARDYTLVIA